MSLKPKKVRIRKKGSSRSTIVRRVSKGLDALMELPEGALSVAEQHTLRTIYEKHRKVIPGNVTNTDLKNMKEIALRHRVKF